jgi:8-oxo-dGTP pyrophosphatase MutT (NUDIX family)
MVNKKLMFRTACYLLLIKGNKILLLRRFNTGWGDGKYTLISGHLDGDETVKQAMVREAKEEAGINLDTKDLRVVHTMHRKSNDNLEYVDFFLVAEKWQGQSKINEQDKCDDMQWFPLKNLPKNMLPHIRQAVENYFRKVPFSELGFE